nr:hypothetical protein [Mucilaginibacter sp. SP1R1]
MIFSTLEDIKKFDVLLGLNCHLEFLIFIKM